MAPTIDTGDMVVLKRLDRPARVGDIVSVSVPEEARARFGYPPVVIHRIVGIAADGAVTTKGDAHAHPDPFTVPSTSLRTTVVATVPAAGRVVAFLGSPLGLLWLVGGGALLLGMPIVDRYRGAQRRDEEERVGLQAALEAVTAELVLAREERDDDADRAEEQLRLVRRQLDEVPERIERAIAQAFAAAAPPPPPPPVAAAAPPAPPQPVAADGPSPPPPPVAVAASSPPPVAAPAPTPVAVTAAPSRPHVLPAPAPPPPAILPAPTPDLFARRFVPASQFTPPPTPDLMSALRPAEAPLPWDAPRSTPVLDRAGPTPLDRRAHAQWR